MKVKAKDLVQASNVGAPAVSNDVKRGNLIRDENKFFDLEEPINKNWCIRKGIDPTTCKKTTTVKPKVSKKENPKKKTKQSRNKKDKNLAPIQNIMSDGEFETMTGLPAKMMNLTLQQLVMRYGGPMQLKGFVDIMDKILSAQVRDVKIQEVRKNLVPRKFVEYLKTYIDTLMNQLFDYANGSASEIVAIAKSNPEKAKIKIPEMLRKDFSKLAMETQKRIDKDIKNLKVEDDTID